MIWDSSYWKEELRKHAESLIHHSTKRKRFGQAAQGKVEQDAMIGCFIVRRLIGAKKVSTQISKRQIHLRGYPFKVEPKDGDEERPLPNYFNWHNIDQHYDLKASQSVTLAIGQLCNQMIHTFIFMPVMSRKKTLSALWFTSDRKRGARLFEIETLALAELFTEIADNYPASVRATRDKDGQWIVRSYDESEGDTGFSDPKN